MPTITRCEDDRRHVKNRTIGPSIRVCGVPIRGAGARGDHAGVERHRGVLGDSPATDQTPYSPEDSSAVVPAGLKGGLGTPMEEGVGGRAQTRTGNQGMMSPQLHH